MMTMSSRVYLRLKMGLIIHITVQDIFGMMAVKCCKCKLGIQYCLHMTQS